MAFEAVPLLSRQAEFVLTELITCFAPHSAGHKILTRNLSKSLLHWDSIIFLVPSLPQAVYLLGVHPKNSPDVKLTPLDVKQCQLLK